jgi:GNAT superfamily N-acetyltransferase
MPHDLIEISGAPDISGLIFRQFRGSSDFPKMAAAIAASADADNVERADTAEDLAAAYAHLSNCDPSQDMVLAEIDGEVIGYSRGFWFEEEHGPLIYVLVGFLVPAWRRKGIGAVMLHWMENHLRVIANGHSAERAKLFQCGLSQSEVGLTAMLEREGYYPVRYGWIMLRSTQDGIPDFPLPEGLEVRPLLPEHYRAAWDASVEAFRGGWGFAQPTDEQYEAWKNRATFQPHLWQIAWDVATNQIAGQVHVCIDPAQNEKFRRKRGWLELVCVGQAWRKRGLAHALITRALHVQKEQGMTESTLGVDSENVSGATRVYEDCGFLVEKRNTIYRKPL